MRMQWKCPYNAHAWKILKYTQTEKIQILARKPGKMPNQNHVARPPLGRKKTLIFS